MNNALNHNGSREGRGLTIEVSHVTKRYGKNVVVDELSFVVRPGRVTGFLGPNGSGKSTTMKIMLDLASADAGDVAIGGVRYRDLPDPARAVGVLLEANACHPGRSGRNHLRILADATGIPTERVDQLLDQVGLAPAANRHVGGYSLGMRQRLGLAAAMLGDPPVLILDEPGNGLDPQGMRELRELLRHRAESGDTVLVSSHLLAEMEHVADDLVVINHGRLVTSGPLADLRQSAFLVRTPCPELLREVLLAAGGVVVPTDPDTLVVRILSMDEIGEQAFRAGIPIYELASQSGSLEDLFLDWTSDARDGVNAGPRVKERVR
ncbi:MAG: ABC transporter ATP-binding protein [Miltoncostaeaceae bacterium]